MLGFYTLTHSLTHLVTLFLFPLPTPPIFFTFYTKLFFCLFVCLSIQHSWFTDMVDLCLWVSVQSRSMCVCVCLYKNQDGSKTINAFLLLCLSIHIIIIDWTKKIVYSKVHSICYLSVSGICILSLALGDRMKKNKTNRWNNVKTK